MKKSHYILIVVVLIMAVAVIIGYWPKDVVTSDNVMIGDEIFAGAEAGAITNESYYEYGFWSNE